MSSGPFGWLQDRIAQRLARWAQRHYRLPYPPLHYYMPIANLNTIRARGLDKVRFADTSREIDMALVEATAEATAMTAGEQSALPSYFDPDVRNLGLGFGEVEGHFAYAMVRNFKPAVVLEVGAGVSTYYLKAALDRNGGGRLVAIEPYPLGPLVAKCRRESIDLRKTSAADLTVSEVNALAAEGPLMVSIDSTHVLRLDGELPNLLLNILPALPSGTVVHLHDVTWPFGMIFTGHEMAPSAAVWNESLAVALLLKGSTDFEILMPMYMLVHDRPELLEQACPLYARTRQVATSFWIRRR